MFHKHNWDLIDKTVIPAAISQLANFKVYGAATYDALDALQEHVVHVFKCECGKVKVVKN